MRIKLILGFILLEMLCSAIGHSSYNEEKDADVIIVGGGISGLAAAGRLAKAGLSCLILEARDRLGGRMYTLQGEDVLELGAQFISGDKSTNPLFQYAESKNLLDDPPRQWEFYPTSFNPQGEAYSEEEFATGYYLFNIIEQSIHNVVPKFRNESVGDYYFSQVYSTVNELDPNEYSEEDKKELTTMLEGFGSSLLSGNLASMLETVNLYLYGKSNEEEGDAIVPHGLSSIINALAGDLGSSKYELNSVVEKIQWTEQGVSLKTDSKMYTSDHAIVTVPVGVLQKRPELFSPGLDEKKQLAIRNMNPGKLSKIVLQYDVPFWSKGEGDLLFFQSKEEQDSAVMPQDWFKFIIFTYEVDGSSDKLYLIVVEEGAVVADQLADSEIAQEVTNLFQRTTGNFELPLPSKIIRHTWLTDPFTLGVYSSPNTNATSSDYTELARPLPSADQPRLLLAGEHVHPLYWSYMHGAMLTGINQAEKIIKFREGGEN